VSYYHDLATLIGIQMIAVLGVFVLTGLTGLMSFGQGGFMALAAYTAALSHMKLGVPWPLSLLLGVVVSSVAAALFGYPALRLKGDFFGLATFGFGEAITAVFQIFTQLTGGSMGMAGIPRYTNLWLALGGLLLAIYLVANLKRSRLGRSSLAIRGDELAAEGLGVDVFAHRLQVFVFSAALAGLAGGMQAFLINYMDPRIFNWTTSVEQVIVVYFGGVNSLTGCLISAVILSTLPELLQFLREWRVVLYGILVILTLILRPQGLLGDHEFGPGALRALSGLLTRRRGSAPPGATGID